MKNIGTIVIIGLIVWWLTQRQKEVQAAEVLPSKTYPAESEYEKLHRVVPITRYMEKEIPVYQTIEEWKEAHG